MNDIRREFQRVFEFVVKHGVSNSAWTNADTKRFLRWAWANKHLLIVHDGEGDSRRIVAAAVCWQTDHPENRYRDFSFDNTARGEYLSVYQVIVHPEFRSRGCMLLLLAMACQEHPGVRKAFWNSHSRGRNYLRIIDIQTLGKELLKWDYRAKPLNLQS